jgi:hypothetical protein
MKKNISESQRAAELVRAQPSLCWENAAKLMSHDVYAQAMYVEGAIVTPILKHPQEHAWLAVNGEIIDPTLPDKEVFYFPAHEWTAEAVDDLLVKYKQQPFFRQVEFLTDGVQVQMDEARSLARQFAATLPAFGHSSAVANT